MSSYDKSFFPCRRKRRTLLLALFFLVVATAARAEVIDQVAAVVNDDVITASELEKETQEQYRAAVKNGRDDILTSMEIIREKTLNSIIDRKLIEQKAEEMNVEVTEAEVDQAFNDNVARSGVPKKVFLYQMQNAGVREKTYRRNLRTSLLQGKLVNIDVQSKIVITNEMVERYYQKNYVKEVDDKMYNLLQMGFSWGVDADGRERSRENALELAHKIRADVLIGKDFAKLARKYSDLPSAADGGDIGGFTLDDMAEQMADAVKDLRPSEVSKIIATDDSYQFYQLTSIKKHFTVVKDSFKNVKKEIREQLYREKLRQAYKTWIANLKANAYIKKLH